MKRHGFTLVEMVLAMAIATVLLAGLFAAIQVSVDAYGRATAEHSSRLTCRLVLERLAFLIRSSVDFGPKPGIATEIDVESDTFDMTTASGDEITVSWDAAQQSLDMTVNGTTSMLLAGVTQQVGGESITPFLLQFDGGTKLWRLRMDLAVEIDVNTTTAMDTAASRIRLTKSIMPRSTVFE